MRLALLTDVHANREALTACLEHAKRGGAQRHVFLGDLVGYGADPEAVLDLVQERVSAGGAAVLGNHDAAVAAGHSSYMPPDIERAIAWTHVRLDPARLAFLGALPLQVEESGRLYVHANAWAPSEWEYVLGPLDAGRSLRATSCRWTFCGHTHNPALYHMTAATQRVRSFAPIPGVGVPLGLRRRWLAVPGSCGQPRDGNPAASYALFDDETHLMTWFRVPYDHERAARKIRAAGLPERFAAILLEERP
jgi:diadenosine tetraphosphatase ApaH/serine/threonine PP2A family protein phosphatase